jgi:hypothetical protein
MERNRSRYGDRVDQAHVQSDGPASYVGRAGGFVRLAGMGLSLGLAVGGAVWAVQLTMRDVSGVPVIRALEGPMRSAPEEPGGILADHMGLAVNRLAEGAEAGAVPDRLVLAPKPLELTPIALTSASLSVDAAGSETDAPTPEAVSAQIHELIARLMVGNDPVDPAGMGEPTAASDVQVSERADTPSPAVSAGGAEVPPAVIAAVAQSLRPVVRPGGPVAAQGAALVQASASAPVELDAARLPAGTRLVQLGAFETPDLARSEWARLTGLFPDYFTGRAPVIQEASSGGAPFYRLRAHGFEDLAESRRFCAALTAQNAPCITVTVR